MNAENDLKLTEFEKKWNDRIKKIKQSEMSTSEARKNESQFELDDVTNRFTVTNFEIEEYNKRIEKIKWELDFALNQAKTNFQNGESNRLHIRWGALGGFAFLIKSIFRML